MNLTESVALACSDTDLTNEFGNIIFVCFVYREFMSIRFYYYIVKIITFFNITLNT